MERLRERLSLAEKALAKQIVGRMADHVSVMRSLLTAMTGR